MIYSGRHIGRIFIFCLFCLSVHALASRSVSSEPLEAILRPVEEGLHNIPYHHIGRNTAQTFFSKEPVYAGSEVYRQTLIFGAGQTERMGMAYDVTADRLYIDWNRNLDLTDDGPGIPGDNSPDAGFSEFANIAVEVLHGDISVRYMLTLQFARNYFVPVITSGWTGEIEIAGHACVMSVADNMDGLFGHKDTFLFDHERHRAARLPYGRADTLPLPQWMHFQGQAYRITFELRVIDDETALAVTLVRILDDLMEIEFEGRFVSRVLLKESVGEGYGWLDWPVSTMSIPQGVYSIWRVDLLDSFYGYPDEKAVLATGGNKRLHAGGPLRQKVSVQRNGSDLSMSYSLLGANDVFYYCDQEQQNPSGFALYQGNTMVGRDQFEYG